MKNNILSIPFLLAVCAISVVSCSKATDAKTDSETEKSASFKIMTRSITVLNPTLTYTTAGGVTNNTIKLSATNGSRVEINFAGTSFGTFPMLANSNARYFDSTGKEYHSVNGQLALSTYVVDGSTHITSGSFYFRAKAITAPIDSFQISYGKFSNASN